MPISLTPLLPETGSITNNSPFPNSALAYPGILYPGIVVSTTGTGGLTFSILGFGSSALYPSSTTYPGSTTFPAGGSTLTLTPL